VEHSAARLKVTLPPGDYLDAEGHPIPSVTQIIAQLRSSYRGAAIEEAAIVGKVAHRLIEQSILGQDVDDEVVPEGARQAFSAWQGWRFMREPKLATYMDAPASEISLQALGDTPYGGRLDLVLDLDHRLIVADLKTRSAGDKGLPTPDRYSMTQLGGYSLLWEGATGQRLAGGLILMLGRDAPLYRECWLDRVALDECEIEFRALLTAYYAHERRKVVLRDTRAAV
jgi:hypothetical protein